MKKLFIITAVAAGLLFPFIQIGSAEIFCPQDGFTDKQGAVWYYKSYLPPLNAYEDMVFIDDPNLRWHVPPWDNTNPNKTCIVGPTWQIPGKTLDSVREFRIPANVSRIELNCVFSVPNRAGHKWGPPQSDGVKVTI